MLQKWQAWLNQHPWWNGLFLTVETAVITAGGTVLDAALNDRSPLSKQSLKNATVYLATALLVAVRNYLKQPPPKKDEP